MKLRVFHASDGDCLLLSSSDAKPRRILIDGGRKSSFEDHTRAVLGQLREAGGKLHVVCVSHIDDDHISGVLKLVEDEVRQGEYHVMILDVMMPKLDGIEVLKRVRAVDSDVAVIMFTAHPNLETAVASMKNALQDVRR